MPRALSPRRPRALACAQPPPLRPPPRPKETLRTRLERLLRLLPGMSEDEGVEAGERDTRGLPERVQMLFGPGGALDGLRFWRANRGDIEEAASGLREAGEAAVRGDVDGVRRGARRVKLDWLLPGGGGEVTEDGTGEAPGVPVEARERVRAGVNLERMVRNVVMYGVDTLTPWDFDRHDFGLTFVQTWEEAGESEGDVGRVKMTSTIKPLEREWKVSARSKLVEVGRGGVVFGKAGVYLAGEKAAYVGVEADRVWRMPRTGGAMMFVNVNYRSSRRPGSDAFKMSVGVQKGFEVWGGRVVWLRVGVDPVGRERVEVTPVPNGEYF